MFVKSRLAKLRMYNTRNEIRFNYSSCLATSQLNWCKLNCMTRNNGHHPKTIFLISFLGFFIGFTMTRPSQNPNPILLVPKIAQVYLPPPLALSPPSSNVLGAETFDPLDLIRAINAERVKKNENPLRVSDLLMKAAKLRADVILKYQNFSHQDPYEGIELVTVLPKVNYHFAFAGENIGMGGGGGTDFTLGFMASIYHREMLLRPDLVDTGAAIVTGPYKQYYVNYAVQLFAIPGGPEESRGYTTEDIQRYKDQLSYIDNQLSPVRWVIGKTFQKTIYTDSRHKTLKRQKIVLAAVYKRMQKNEPLDINDALLIQEYNRLSARLSPAIRG